MCHNHCVWLYVSGCAAWVTEAACLPSRATPLRERRERREEEEGKREERRGGGKDNRAAPLVRETLSERNERERREEEEGKTSQGTPFAPTNLITVIFAPQDCVNSCFTLCCDCQFYLEGLSSLS